MSEHSAIPIAGTMYEPCPGCRGTGKNEFQGIRRPCTWCRGKGKLPVSRADGEGWMKKGGQL